MKKTDSGKKENIAMRRAISFFGGTVKLAKNLGIRPNHIPDWLYEKRLIPVKHAVQIEYLTNGKIKASELRPDIFKQSIREVKKK